MKLRLGLLPIARYSLRKSKGFTLIELLIVIAIIGILSVISIAGFVSYSNSQALNNAAADVATMLNVAKSRAQSQIKPTTTTTTGGCDSNNSLSGYAVGIYNNNNPSATNQYSLQVLCGSNVCDDSSSLGSSYKIGDVKSLPANLTFSSSACFTFKVLTGETTGDSSVTINGNGSSSKTISVDAQGNITVN